MACQCWSQSWIAIANNKQQIYTNLRGCVIHHVHIQIIENRIRYNMCADWPRAFLPHGMVGWGCKKYLQPEGLGRPLRQHPFNFLKHISEESSEISQSARQNLFSDCLLLPSCSCCAALTCKNCSSQVSDYLWYWFDMIWLCCFTKLYQCTSSAGSWNKSKQPSQTFSVDW